MAKSKTRHRRRPLLPGELPHVYLMLRYYNKRLGKMITCKGMNLIIRNYTPLRAYQVIKNALDEDARQLWKAQREKARSTPVDVKSFADAFEGASDAPNRDAHS